MQPQRYTELFFLDEAVAVAAGHRPCAFCRPAAYHAFIHAWSGASRATVLDTALHQERVSRIRGRKHWQAELGTLPNGSFVVLLWTAPLMVEVLTPPSIVLILREGYQPILHSSADTI